MLSTIKNMIKEKTSFLEAANIIFEDGSGMNLDDQIILGEETDTSSQESDNKDYVESKLIKTIATNKLPKEAQNILMDAVAKKIKSAPTVSLDILDDMDDDDDDSEVKKESVEFECFTEGFKLIKLKSSLFKDASKETKNKINEIIKSKVPISLSELENDGDGKKPIEPTKILITITEGTEENDDEEESDNEPTEEPTSDKDDLLDSEVDSEPETNPEHKDDLLDSEVDANPDEGQQPNTGIDEIPNQPGLGIPTPMGAQTGEPINPLDDIANVEIDLGSNTMKDTLPIPPAGASGVVPEDENNPSQHVDSGFGESADVLSTIESIKSTINGYDADVIDDSNQSGAGTILVKLFTDNYSDEEVGKIIITLMNFASNNGGTFSIDIDERNTTHKLYMKLTFPSLVSTSTTKPSSSLNPESTSSSSEECEQGEAATAPTPTYVESYFSSLGLGSKAYQEAITLADNDEESNDSNDNSDTTQSENNNASKEPAEESPVTSAVKDKVSDSEEELDSFNDVDEDISSEEGSEARIEILKKLGSITKNIEDAKKAVMNSIK